jgi:outer membrane protein assembly factor BamE (lipoprotein component of BamABCDE complex)
VFFVFFIPLNLCIIIYGVYVAIRASAITGLSSGKDNKSFVLSPEDLARWRSIKPGMDRHEVTAILGQPDGPPVVVTRTFQYVHVPEPFMGKIVYEWGVGRIFFEPNSGPVIHVKIPEYV